MELINRVRMILGLQRRSNRGNDDSNNLTIREGIKPALISLSHLGTFKNEKIKQLVKSTHTDSSLPNYASYVLPYDFGRVIDDNSYDRVIVGDLVYVMLGYNTDPYVMKYYSLPSLENVTENAFEVLAYEVALKVAPYFLEDEKIGNLIQLRDIEKRNLSRLGTTARTYDIYAKPSSSRFRGGR